MLVGTDHGAIYIMHFPIQLAGVVSLRTVDVGNVVTPATSIDDRCAVLMKVTPRFDGVCGSSRSGLPPGDWSKKRRLRPGAGRCLGAPAGELMGHSDELTHPRPPQS